MARPFEISLTFSVKSYDVDYVGYVHNAVYMRWLEDLRVAMMEPHYSLERCVGEGISPIILKTSIDYIRPLRLFDRFNGTVWVDTLEGVRWGVRHELVHGGHVAATAEQSGIFIQLATHRPARVPEELARKFTALRLNAGTGS